jgi:hypothetical protein
VHTALLGYIRDALSLELPADLAARMEERVTVATGEEGMPAARRADVALVETWQDGSPPVWSPKGGEEGQPVAVDEPIVFLEEPEPARWVEIRDARGRLVTAIKVLSPATSARDGRNTGRASTIFWRRASRWWRST